VLLMAMQLELQMAMLWVLHLVRLMEQQTETLLVWLMVLPKVLQTVTRSG